MKILLANTSLQCGGAERVLSEFANYLVDNGHDVYFLLLSEKPIFFDLDKRVKIYSPGFRRNDFIILKFVLKLTRYIRTTIKDCNPDSILSFIFPSYFLLSTLGLNFPKYISIRNSPIAKADYDFSFLRKLLFPKAKGIIVQTEFSRRVIFQQVKHQNIKVIPNFSKIIDDDFVGKENIIVSVGRLVNGKGHDDLLDIFSFLNNINWKLYIVGEGPLEQYLRKRIKELSIEGSVSIIKPQKNIEKILLKSKLFAFCSYHEGFPNAILEAMTCSLPCIVYDCIAGPSDLVRDSENGFLIPVGNKQLFADKLNLLMNNDSLRIEFSINSLEISKKYDRDLLLKTYFKFISE